MLCVTGNEPSAATWQDRVDADERLATAHGIARPMEELRLDHLEAIDDRVFELLTVLARRAELVVTCRPTRQGGAFDGEERDRVALLARAAACGVATVDVEADVHDEALATIRAAGTSTTRPKLLLSWHDFTGLPDDLRARTRAMAKRDADGLKLAVSVADAADISPLLESVEGVERPRVVLAMGDAGLLTRTHYASFGSPFTYVAARSELATAPGQLSLARALDLGLPASAEAPLYGLVGGPQIRHSPGPRVYNRLFRERGFASSYVPIVTSSLARTLPILERIGARGLAVTMPHKTEALALARPDARATAVGAANSLRFRDGWEATNTDIEGIREPLRSHLGDGAVTRARVLGAGGAARAAVYACRELALAIEVAARDPRAAGNATKGGGRTIAWDERASDDALHDAVVINATPLTGADGPWPDGAPLRARVVFDTALGPGPSTLLQRARDEGASVIEPLAMWLAQAAAQLRWMTGIEVTSDELEAFTR